MSGAVSGVQKIIHDKTPYGFYVHCSAHRVNLCLVDACKAVLEAEDFFAVMERLYCFLSTSVVHHLWIAKQKEIYSKEQPLEQWFLTGGTRTTWGYEEPKQGVRSTKVFKDTRSGNLNQILLNIHRDSL